MDITIKTPVQIFINDRFFCIANEVEIKRSDPKFRKSLIPDNIKVDPKQFTGTVVYIKKPPRTKKEIAELKKAKKKGGYDEFFSRMVGAVDDPAAHIPIDTDGL